MQEESTEVEKSTPGQRSFGTETMGETTRSLFAMAPVVLEPGLIVLEKFRIIDLLGQGGMGSVYRVEHLLMGRQFALKCLNKFQEADASWRRFQNEAKAAHLLDHANLLKVYEFGLLPGGQPFFLMELVEGETLADEIKRLGQLPVDRAVRIFIQVAFALSYAHESHVIHRDIKPSNIMVSRKGQAGDAETVKVVDFGIAKLTGIDEFNQQTLTKTGEIFGSPLYMSPEQCTGVAVDHRSDLYSLGCVFYEALTGAPPFIGETALSTMMKHQGEKPLSLKEASLGTQYPQSLENIVAKLLEKDPAERYQSAHAVSKDLIQLERRLTEESQGTLQAIDSAQAAKKVDLPKKDAAVSTASSTVPMSLCLVIAAGMFFLGALTSYMFLGPNLESYFGLTKKKDKSAANEASPSGLYQISQLKADDPAYEKYVKSSTHWSEISGSERVYRFPQKNSLGLILTSAGVERDAAGEFTLKSNDEIGLIPSEFLVANPALLDKFRPDELILIDMNCNQSPAPEFYRRMSNFSGLKFLNAGCTAFKPSTYILSKLPELVHLDVAWDRIAMKEMLQQVHTENLNYLNVSWCKDADAFIHEIEKFPKLRQLIMVKCDLKNDDLKGLCKSKVKTLCIGWNDDIDDRGIENLSELKGLLKIDLSATKVSPQVWKALKQIPHLQTVKVAMMSWSLADKLYFLKQMRMAMPDTRVDFDAKNFKEFTTSSTDVDWLNKGIEAHDPPLKELADKSMKLFDEIK